MKKTKKLLALTLGLSVLFTSLVFTGCPQPNNGLGDGTGTGETGGGDNGGKDEGGIGSGIVTSNKVKFNLSGAQALATFNDKGEGAKSARDADGKDLGVLAKIMEDGSMESVIQLEGEVEFPEIKYILKSPSAKKNQLYIVLAGDVYDGGEWVDMYYDENWNLLGKGNDKPSSYAWNSPEYVKNRIMGSLICVYEDGSFADVITPEEGINRRLSSVSESWYYSDDASNIDPVVFDKNGYAYYVTREWKADGYEWDDSATNIIYRFNPNTGKSELITTPFKGYTYSKIQVSDDGNWIFVQGRKSGTDDSAEFIRAIPVSNPDTAQNLVYSSNGYIRAGDWLYDENTKAVYATIGLEGKKSGLVKFFKDDNGNYTPDSYKNFVNVNNGMGNPTSSWYKESNLNDKVMSNTYYWNGYTDDEGNVDYSAIIERMISEINNWMPVDYYTEYLLLKESDEYDESGNKYYDVVATEVPLKSGESISDYDEVEWTHYLKYCYRGEQKNMYFYESDIEKRIVYGRDNEHDYLPSKDGYNDYINYNNIRKGDFEVEFSIDYSYDTYSILKEGYELLTKEDVDFRLDNPAFSSATFSSSEDFKALLKAAKGKKNEALLEAISKSEYLKGLKEAFVWNDRYNSSTNTKGEYYKHNVLADVLYIKGTDDLLCDTPDNKYFAESTAKAGNFNNSNLWFFYDKIGENSSPIWKAEFYDENNELDAEKILEYFYSLASVDSGEFEFRLDWLEDTDDDDLAELYTTKKNAAAVKYIMEDEDRFIIFSKLFRDFRYWTPDNKSDKNEWYADRWDISNISWFVAHTCFIKGTDDSIIPQIIAGEKYFIDKANNVTPETPIDDYYSTYFCPSSNWDWEYTKDLVMFEGELWGVYGYNWSSDPNSNKVFRLLDEDGLTYSGYVSPEFKDLHIKNIKKCEKGFYFKNIFLNKDETESGYQDIRLFDIGKDKVINLFDQLPNKMTRTVESYTLAGDQLYICTSMGRNIDNIVIDINTGASEVLGTGRKLAQIIGFKM